MRERVRRLGLASRTGSTTPSRRCRRTAPGLDAVDGDVAEAADALARRAHAALDPKSADQVVRLTRKRSSGPPHGDDGHALDAASASLATSRDDAPWSHHSRLQRSEKRRLRADDLLARFEEVRRGERLDESAAECCAACTFSGLTCHARNAPVTVLSTAFHRKWMASWRSRPPRRPDHNTLHLPVQAIDISPLSTLFSSR